MKNIAFTICSNNYLSQAKVLSDSVYKYSRDSYDFYIILCDVLSDKIDYSEFHASFIEVKDLGIDNFGWMADFYNIIELNTAIKPFAFKYLIKNYSPEFIHYLDPDTCTYASLKLIEDELTPDFSILLTPHSLDYLPFDGLYPSDNDFLNVGIYNLGFLGLKVRQESLRMLDWWCDFLSEHCLIDMANGYFVDQLPMELVPLYFEEVKVSKNRGINVAYWNLHERKVEKKGEIYVVNDKFPLVLFHFSSYNLNTPNRLSRYETRIDMIDFPALVSLFDEYREKMINTRLELYKSIKCYYTKNEKMLLRKFIYKATSGLRKMSVWLYDKAHRM